MFQSLFEIWPCRPGYSLFQLAILQHRDFPSNYSGTVDLATSSLLYHNWIFKSEGLVYNFLFCSFRPNFYLGPTTRLTEEMCCLNTKSKETVKKQNPET